MIAWIRALLKKEGAAYIIVGGMTTAVNFLVFTLVNELLKPGLGVSLSSKAAYAAAFAAAVIFAYWTNKFWVFHHPDMTPAVLFREFLGFAGARIFSGVITFFLQAFCVDVLHLNEYLALAGTTGFNLVFNYFASKFWVFRKNEVAVHEP